MFAEQEGLSDFIGKNIEKELHIQFASCAENRIITNHQKANRKCHIFHNLLTKKTTAKYIKVYLWIHQFIASFWDTRRKFAKYLKKQLLQNMNNYHLIILPKSQKWLLVNPHLWTPISIKLEPQFNKNWQVIQNWTLWWYSVQGITVVCDGSPLQFYLSIIKKTYTCAICNTLLFKKENCIAHCIEAYNKIIAYYQELDWVLLKPAERHSQMNSIKAFFKWNWEWYAAVFYQKDLSYKDFIF